MSQHPTSKKLSHGGDFTPTTHNDTYDFINPTQFDLAGRAVLVTGASKGIGRATCASFAKAGASFIALGARSPLEDTEKATLDAAEEAGRPTPKVLKLNIDVTSEESVAATAKEIESQFGKLDILVNNAGYLEPFCPIADSKVSEWWTSWEVNIKGVYLTIRALLPLLRKNSDGLKTILNTSSVGAHRLSPGASGYQTNKLAVARLSEFVCTEYDDVLCYSFHPGGVATELALGMPSYMHEYLSDTPELAGDSVVWYSAKRRDWLRGRWLSVQWDAKELEGMKERLVKEDLLKVRLDVGLE